MFHLEKFVLATDKSFFCLELNQMYVLLQENNNEYKIAFL